jgi:hypothetical protein
MSPSIAPAQVVDRVQGIDSSLSDLTLRDGRRLAIELGGAITGRPELTRTVDGGSSVKISVRDQDLSFLQASLLAEKWDANIDGLHFRYMGADLGESSIDLTLKDRDIAILEEYDEPVSALRRDMTRAEFIVSLVRKARPHAPITCPQLHVIQPIETNRQAAKARDAAKIEKGKGLGDGKGLTMDGSPVGASELELADMALRIAESAKAPTVSRVALIEALMGESGLGKASPGNVLQALEPYTQIRPAAEEISGFLTGKPKWTGVTAIGYAKAHPDAPAHEIAQAVQKSDAGEASNGAANYGKFEAEARAFVEAFGGGEYGGVISATGTPEPYEFAVGSERKGENWWEAIKRFAEDVNWRAFWVAGRFFYMDEIELFRSQVRLAIDRDTKGIQKMTGSWRANRRATEMTVEAFAKRWRVPPGSVVTVAEYGPFSIGFGDAPLRKGQKIALSNNRKAASGEGRARYLVESIGVPLRDSDNGALKRVSVTLRKPTAPLPEPAAETKSTTPSSGSAAGGNQKAQELYDWCERQIGKPYVWGAVGPSSYDCSGFVSAGLMEVGLLEARLTTSTFASWGEAGEGEFITVHDKNGTGDPHTEHIIIEVLGDLFECGGVSGGVGKPPAGYERGFPTKRHPKGF